MGAAAAAGAAAAEAAEAAAAEASVVMDQESGEVGGVVDFDILAALARPFFDAAAAVVVVVVGVAKAAAVALACLLLARVRVRVRVRVRASCGRTLPLLLPLTALAAHWPSVVAAEVSES